MRVARRTGLSMSLAATGKRPRSPATESPTKLAARKKRNKAPASVPDVPIKIQVGEGEAASVVYIHRSRLDKVSPWFKRTAAHTEVIELDHVSAETLQTFYKWVYEEIVDMDGLEEEMEKGSEDNESEAAVKHNANSTSQVGLSEGNVVVDLTDDVESSLSSIADEEEDNDEDEEDDHSKSATVTTLDGEDLPWYLTSSLNIRGQLFGRLLDLYIFSSTYEIPAFKLDVMLTWQRFSHATDTYPCATVIRNVIQRVPTASGLVQYLIGCYAHYVEIEDLKKNRHRWKTVQSEFLTEVLILALERAEKDDAGNEPNYRWCEYHEHESEGEKATCQRKDGRKGDPDVVYRIRRPVVRRWGGCC
ncbi:Nn.00g064670.m01.CDS01 [Neocucurbitaria sp. VM-36]